MCEESLAALYKVHQAQQIAKHKHDEYASLGKKDLAKNWAHLDKKLEETLDILRIRILRGIDLELRYDTTIKRK